MTNANATLAAEVIQLAEGNVIYFAPKHELYGHAEFVFCVEWKRGKIRRVHVTPHQQGRKERWCLECAWGPTTFQVGSWEHKGIEVPRMWISGYCRGHKAISYSVYVPLNANVLTLAHVGSGVDFRFESTELRP